MQTLSQSVRCCLRKANAMDIRDRESLGNFICWCSRDCVKAQGGTHGHVKDLVLQNPDLTVVVNEEAVLFKEAFAIPSSQKTVVFGPLSTVVKDLGDVVWIGTENLSTEAILSARQP